MAKVQTAVVKCILCLRDVVAKVREGVTALEVVPGQKCPRCKAGLDCCGVVELCCPILGEEVLN